jgi:hypothetical protein
MLSGGPHKKSKHCSKEKNPSKGSKPNYWLRWLVVADLSMQRPRFMPSSVHVGFVMEKVELGQVFL